MPSKSEIIEDFLAQIEERFYETLKGDSFPHYFGGRVEIGFTTKPRVEINIHEIGKPGPKLGQKFKKRVGPSKAAMRAMNEESEEF